ncbi:tyrosinase family oxidase copper chaperone [Streptomyces sp. NPDC005931]|uniref:tyrosinase family oxidase copper chaperone n=1 Tax=Streptomyces sp. NPDC005931 TaxID=3364737 RepID=UPI00367BC1F5
MTGSVKNTVNSAGAAAGHPRPVVSAPAAPDAAACPPAGDGRPSAATGHRKGKARRRVLQGLLASGAGAVLAPVLSASGSSEPDEERFSETYRRRRIAGVRHRGRTGEHGAWHVTVDGRPLHVMRRADGSWMTMVDHYESYPTPLAAVRAAVDELGPIAELGAPDGSDRGDAAGRGHHHGVHA